MFVRLSSPSEWRDWYLVFRLPRAFAEVWEDMDGSGGDLLAPCGVFEFRVCEFPGPHIQEVTAANAPFLVPVQACNKQAQMCASLHVPLGSVLSKPGLKRVGSEFRVKAGLVGPLSTSQDITQPYFFWWFLEIRWPTSFGPLSDFMALIPLGLAVKCPYFRIKMHLLTHLCGFLAIPCFFRKPVIRESFPRPDLIGSHTPGSGKHGCFHVSLRKNEETPFLKGEEMLSHLLWSLLYKP